MTATPARLTPGAHEGAGVGEDPAAKPVRRRFTDAYKLAILAEYEQLTDPGAKGRCFAARVSTRAASLSGAGPGTSGPSRGSP